MRIRRQVAKIVIVLVIGLYMMTGLIGKGENANAAERQTVVVGRLGSGLGQVGKIVTTDYDVLPHALAVDTSGSIFLSDHINDRIVKYSPSGHFSFAIPFPVTKKRYALTVDDVEVDVEGNLYVASRHEMKMNKYDSRANLLFSLDLRDRKICWDARKGWWSCAIQISRLATSHDGAVYLRGFSELIKFNGRGDIVGKWPLDSGGDFALDNNGSLYIARTDHVVESFDAQGAKKWTKRCGEEASRIEGGYCRLPKWIDREGNRYWFKSQGSVIDKTDRVGKVMETIDLQPLHFYGNTAKFDVHGNFYFLSSSKEDFWVEKVSF